MLRYLIYQDGELLRKLGSRIECEPFLRTGCTLKVLPKLKNPTSAQQFQHAHAMCGDAPF